MTHRQEDESKRQAEENKRLALLWYGVLFVGDVDTCNALLHEDCKFFIAGDMAFCGWSSKETFMKMNVLPLAGPIRMEFGHMIAEGDFVFLEAESHADLEGGRRYNNNYAFLLRFSNGKLIEHKEYTDTLHFYRVVDSEAVRGKPMVRQSPLTTISTVVCGDPGRVKLRPFDPQDGAMPFDRGPR
jgi:ketosteroid isomerase-like protein